MNVAECYDVGVAVKFRDSGDLGGIGGIELAIYCAGSARGIYDNLPLDLGVGVDCSQDVTSCGCVGIWVEIEREGDEHGGCLESKQEESEEEFHLCKIDSGESSVEDGGKSWG